MVCGKDLKGAKKFAKKFSNVKPGVATPSMDNNYPYLYKKRKK